MANEHGEWIMYGVDDNDPYCLHTVNDAINYINEIGFLPLFKNEVPGFSLEERTVSRYWWSGITAVDPWEWRVVIASSEKIAYGKFFDKKAGFISLEWLPCFVNYRRDGYDFDALWDEGKAQFRQKKIMDCFFDKNEYYSHRLKQDAGFGKGGEKNFEGTVTDLQMMTYLCVKDFRQKLNKQHLPYGWPLSVYTTPEILWGRELVTSAYGEEPCVSRDRIFNHIREKYGAADEKQILSLLK